MIILFKISSVSTHKPKNWIVLQICLHLSIFWWLEKSKDFFLKKSFHTHVVLCYQYWGESVKKNWEYSYSMPYNSWLISTNHEMCNSSIYLLRNKYCLSSWQRMKTFHNSKSMKSQRFWLDQISILEEGKGKQLPYYCWEK